jgi:hypothetical protein
VRSLQAACESKVHEISAAVKAQVATGDGGGPSESVRKLVRELEELRAIWSSEIRRLQDSAGISEAEMVAAERAYEEGRLPDGNDFWQRQILEIRATEDLDAQTESGLEALLELVNPKWLHEQAQKPYRLGPTFLAEPLHLVNGVRVGAARQAEGPQRFARMLLLSQDHLKKEWDLDFFSAAVLVPEVAILGNSLKEIQELGPDAKQKLASLSLMPDDMVAATVFELLVGAACIRRGMKLQMLQEDRSHKVPDYRILGLGVPATIECKRRLGLAKYELNEASLVENLYMTIRGPLRDDFFHGSIEVSFKMPVNLVPPSDFLHDVLAATKNNQSRQAIATPWGSLAIRHLPRLGRLVGTRLYSPDFLQRVFDWNPVQDEWDGLLCEVDAPPWIGVENFAVPLCLKWRSESEEALTKKARGVTSLWADAVRQIPDGEIGFVYIAYPEGSRAAVADARTRHILDHMGGKLWHRWSVRVPVSVIIRLYGRSIGGGVPDLIESSVPGAQPGEEFWLGILPGTVFTRQFE